jgi:hypothetical protein
MAHDKGDGSMNRKVFRAEPSGDQRAVLGPTGRIASRPTQEAAIEHARSWGRTDEPSPVVVHGADGRIRTDR